MPGPGRGRAPRPRRPQQAASRHRRRRCALVDRADQRPTGRIAGLASTWARPTRDIAEPADWRPHRRPTSRAGVRHLDVGNPHLVLLGVDDVPAPSTSSRRPHRGRSFPDGVNVEFVAGPRCRRAHDARLGARCRRHPGVRHRRLRGGRGRTAPGARRRARRNRRAHGRWRCQGSFARPVRGSGHPHRPGRTDRHGARDIDEPTTEQEPSTTSA